MKHLGEKIWRLREARGLSQEELAERLDVSRQTVSNWENDKATPDAYKLRRLCDVLDVSADDLLETAAFQQSVTEDTTPLKRGLPPKDDSAQEDLGSSGGRAKRNTMRIALCAVLGIAAALLLAIAIVLFSIPAEAQAITSAFTLTPMMGGIFLLVLSVALLIALAIILFKKK